MTAALPPSAAALALRALGGSLGGSPGAGPAPALPGVWQPDGEQAGACPPDAWQPALVPVLARGRETADVYALTLRAPAGRRAHRPGQFDMLWLPGVGEVPISISSDPREADTIGYTIRAVGRVTRALDAVRVGDLLGVRGPYGVPWPVERARGHDVVVVAGGLGLAPLRALVLALIADRAAFGRVSLLVGARSPDQLVFADELERWSQGGGIDVRISVDTAPPTWTGHVGVVTRLIPSAVRSGAETVAFVCGPEIMMRFAARGLLAAGVSERAIYVSLERNMQCAIGLCGHCQLGTLLLCRDGPVADWSVAGPLLAIEEL